MTSQSHGRWDEVTVSTPLPPFGGETPRVAVLIGVASVLVAEGELNVSRATVGGPGGGCWTAIMQRSAPDAVVAQTMEGAGPRGRRGRTERTDAPLRRAQK